MVSRFGSDRSSVLPRILVIGLVSGLAAACSSDTMRFASDPFGNPFSRSRAEPVMTGSFNDQAAPAGQGIPAGQGVPAGNVQSAPLAAPQQVAAAPLPAPVSTPAPARATGPAGWTALGGTPIVVRQGDTLTGLADRYNVPASAILSANGLARAADVQPGASIVIPVFNAVGSQTASAATAPSAPAQQAAASIPSAPSAAPPRRPQQAAAPAPAPQTQQAQAPQQVASAAPTLQAPASSQPAPAAQQSAPAQPASAPVTTASLPSDAGGLDFRWPARGRVIAGFGTGGNEGINIALPEGTPVRAAEGGTVAYAGSELKGYGNLILVRHDNGYVSAYAHNSELLVKRGDTVRRGQVIANSGRTGNVNAPQLHFEIRRGSDPVDPMPYLRN
jgi:murein DD-endopeptidase MepM/ murein hydrolase activator NlpD